MSTYQIRSCPAAEEMANPFSLPLAWTTYTVVVGGILVLLLLRHFSLFLLVFPTLVGRNTFYTVDEWGRNRFLAPGSQSAFFSTLLQSSLALSLSSSPTIETWILCRHAPFWKKSERESAGRDLLPHVKNMFPTDFLTVWSLFLAVDSALHFFFDFFINFET